MSGMLIVFSGIDGAGKTTQIEHLSENLRAAGHQPVTLWSRGGYTPGCEWLKRRLRAVVGRRLPPPGPSARRTQALSRKGTRRWWLRLATLDLMWLYAIRVRWLLLRGHAVVCDRYWRDTLLDFQLNFPQEDMPSWWLWRLLVRWSPRPDLAFLSLVPLETSLARSREKNEPFADPPAKLACRLRAYQQWQREKTWHVLDGRRAAGELAEEVFSVVQRAVPQD